MADDTQPGQKPDIGTLFLKLSPEKQEKVLGALKGDPLKRLQGYARAARAKQGPPAEKEYPTSEYIKAGLKGGAEGLVGLAKGVGNLIMPHETLGATRAEESKMGPLGRILYNLPADLAKGIVVDPNKAMTAREKETGHSQWSADVILSGLENSLFGGAVKSMEQPSFNPESMRGAAQLGAMYGGTRAVEEALKPENLRNYATKVMNKKLGIKPQEVDTAPGLHAAREIGFQTRWANVKAKAQSLLDSIGPQIDAVAQQAAAKGTKVMGVDKTINSIYDPAIEEAKQIGGDAGKRKVARLQAEKQAAQTVVTQQPSGKLGTAYVDYSKGVDPVQLLAKKRAIMNRGWEASDPQYVKDLNRRLGHAMSRALDNSVPEMRGLNQRYAGLHDVNDAAGQHVSAGKVGLSQRLSGLLQSPATMLMYGLGGMISIGGGFGGKYAGVLGAKALYDSLPSASARASVAAWLADQMSSAGVPQKGTSFQTPKKVQPAPPPPGAPPAAPAAGPPGGAPPNAPATPPPTSGGAGPGTAAGAPGVAAPGAAPSGSSAPAAAAPPPPAGTAPPATAAASIMNPLETMTAAVKDFVAGKTDSAALRSIVEGAIGKGDKAELVMKQARDMQLEQKQKQTAAAKPATKPKVTKVAEGVSGFDETKKKYFDMIPDIMAKMDAAPNGMVRAALQKTFDNVKQILNPATDPTTRADLIKKVDKSLEKAEERAKSASQQHVEKGATAETEVSETGGRSFEPLAPEIDMPAALDRVKELEGEIKKFKGGSNMLRAFDAKFGKLTAPDKAGELLAMYTFMKENPKMFEGLGPGAASSYDPSFVNYDKAVEQVAAAKADIKSMKDRIFATEPTTTAEAQQQVLNLRNYLKGLKLDTAEGEAVRLRILENVKKLTVDMPDDRPLPTNTPLDFMKRYIKQVKEAVDSYNAKPRFVMKAEF